MEVSPLRAYVTPVPNGVAIYPSKECGVYSFKVKKYSSVCQKDATLIQKNKWKERKERSYKRITQGESCLHFHLYLNMWRSTNIINHLHCMLNLAALLQVRKLIFQKLNCNTNFWSIVTDLSNSKKVGQGSKCKRHA